MLCDYAGIEAQVVQGYARGLGSSRFRTNHTWNTVKIDSAWQLVDVTWASGYMNYRDEYVQQQNDYYFFTPPDLFIRDHFPEELRWTLLPQPPQMAEFKRAPFLTKNFHRYGFENFSAASGVIEASAGDTLQITLQLKDMQRAKSTGNDPFNDTANFTAWPLSTFLKPAEEKKNSVVYRYVVQPSAEWLHLLFNNDVVLQYRVEVRGLRNED